MQFASIANTSVTPFTHFYPGLHCFHFCIYGKNNPLIYRWISSNHNKIMKKQSLETFVVSKVLACNHIYCGSDMWTGSVSLKLTTVMFNRVVYNQHNTIGHQRAPLFFLAMKYACMQGEQHKLWLAAAATVTTTPWVTNMYHSVLQVCHQLLKVSLLSLSLLPPWGYSGLH